MADSLLFAFSHIAPHQKSLVYHTIYFEVVLVKKQALEQHSFLFDQHQDQNEDMK